MSLPEPLVAFLDSALAFVYSFQPYVEPTVVLVPDFVREGVTTLSGIVGFDEETLGTTLALFLCYPLGLIMLSLPYGTIRHIFSFLLGAFILQFTVGVQWIHQLITSVVVYFMFMILPRKTTKWLVPTFVMTYCVLGHLHRQYINYLGWDLDFTGAQMVITQKLHMMAYNLYDGQQLAAGKADRAAKKCAPFALEKLPGLIEYLGYTFCFASVLTGPALEYSTYLRTCDGSLMLKPDGTPRGKVPSNVWPTLVPFLVSLLNLGIFVGIGSMFPLLDPVDPQKNTAILLTAEFLSRPWIYRYAYQWVGLLAVRQKYYFAWKNAEGAHNIWYAGFEGYDDKGNAKGWDGACNVDILQFETAPNMQTLSKEWNKKTSNWLTRYVYYRTNGSLLAVYSMSAFWHGFYPGYYFFFLSAPIVTMCERLGKKKISPYFSPAKWTPYGILCILSTSFVVEYLVVTFIVLSYERSLGVWKSHMFIGHIVCFIFYAVVSMLPTPKKLLDEKKKKA